MPTDPAPNDTPPQYQPLDLPPDVLALCSRLDATVKAMVAADGDPVRQKRYHQQARRLERELRARVRPRLP